MKFIIIIPARYKSTRLPRKPLVDINGKPMIIHVLNRAYESGADRIIVATDHEEVAFAIKSVGGEVCMTSSDHNSGIERLAEVVEKYNFSNETLVVNIQGDEPMIPVNIIYQVVENLINHQAGISTIAVPIHNKKDIINPNIVKVIINSEGYAIYFSRSVIPWSDNVFSTEKEIIKDDIFFRHIGIYGYRVDFIRRYVTWNQSPIEQIEMLEQLRALWYDEKIYVSITSEILESSIDTPEDLMRIRNMIIK